MSRRGKAKRRENRGSYSGSKYTRKSTRETPKLNGPPFTTISDEERNVFFVFCCIFYFFEHNWRLHSFLIDCMKVIFVLSTIRFVIIRLSIAALFIILQQVMLLLLAILSFAKVQLLLPVPYVASVPERRSFSHSGCG